MQQPPTRAEATRFLPEQIVENRLMVDIPRIASANGDYIFMMT